MAGLDIILDTSFNNPNLPSINPRGFLDDFQRPDSQSLGVTSRESRPWVRPSGSVAVGGAISGGAAVSATTSGYVVEVVDAYTSDGTLRLDMAVVPKDVKPWIVLRAAPGTKNNFISVTFGESVVVFGRWVDGVYTNIKEQGGVTIPASGMVEVHLDGAAISVAINGTVIASVTESAHMSETRHGINFHAGSAIRVDQVSFVRP